jgi:hypothetical protein
MKKLLIFLFIVSSSLIAQEVENYVTVYNQNLGLIKQIRKVRVDLNNPEIRYTDVAAMLIPTSVHLRSETDPNTFTVLEQNFEYDLASADKILQKYIDHDVNLILESGELLNGTLLSTAGNQYVLKTSDGLKILAQNDKMQISVKDLPEGLITRPTLIWKVSGVKNKDQNLEVSYLTNGINWNSEYVGVLNEKDDGLLLGAWVNIDNKSGATYKNAQLKLVAGDIHRAPQPQPVYIQRRTMAMEAKGKDEGFAEKEFFEYHLYTLQRPTTLKNNQMKQISLFPNTSVKTEKKFVYDPQTDSERVTVQIQFLNKKEFGLGIPLPEGIFRIYKKDEKSLEFIGEDRIKHTPRNEEVSLTIGKAFDLLGSKIVIDRKKLSKTSEQQTIEIEIRNNKEKEDLNVLVVEHFYYRYWKIENSNFDFNKKSANKVEFILPVKANNKTTLNYQVTYSW